MHFNKVFYLNTFVSLIFMIFILGCASPERNSAPEKTDYVEIAEPVSATSVKEFNYPWGNPLLLQLKYPLKWEADPEKYGQLKQPEAMLFDSISNYYESLNLAKTIATPDYKSVQVLNPVPREEMNVETDSLMVYHLDSCRLRLPDAGNFECYYFSKTDIGAPASTFGNLLFIDKATRNAKLIQAYHMQGGEQSVKYQFFTVEKLTISTFSGWYYDDGFTLKKAGHFNIDGD
ncbi:MAG: hypothetical protein IPK08_02545 [Bacteroidetes bacterium]|nr:hypothetical protein [Bacteroidota bacterium]